MKKLAEKSKNERGTGKVGATTQRENNVVKSAERPSPMTSVKRPMESSRSARGKNDIVRTITKGAYSGR